MPQLTQKNGARFKSDKKRLKIMMGTVNFEYGNFENGNFDTNLSLKKGWLVYSKKATESSNLASKTVILKKSG